jgi:replicative DNA helicase
MSKITDKAKEYLGYSLSVIPTTKDKTPLGSWKPYQTTRLKEAEVEKVFTKAQGIAIICGAVSGGLEVIDVDTKYDLTGSLWDELKDLIQDSLPELYKRLVIAKSKSGGYHIYYRCKELGGSVKLANRETTPVERGDNPKDKVRVLIETRGEGGYIIAPPTDGYRYVQGDPQKIPLITPDERGALLSIARSLNELPEEEPRAKATSTSPGNSPFEDYNQRGDVIGLLESNGWRVVNQRGDRINLLRPGQTDSKTSGNYHTGLRVLRVFSSSTEFNPDKGYSPSQVFSLLVCSGDDKKAYKELLSQGYGEPLSGDRTARAQLKTERIKVESVNRVNMVNTVISQPGESLRTEAIKTAQGDEILITSPGIEATDEVLKALELIEPTGKRIYISEAGKESRSYFYRLLAILSKYDAILKELGRLTDRQLNSLEDEVVETGSKITEPLDKDRYKKTVLESLKGYGITEESYQITIDRLTSTRDRETQAKELKELLSKATEHQDKGEVDKALEVLTSKVKEVKLRDKATEFSSLLLPVKEEGLRERQAKKTPSISSGYTIGGEELLLPSGAISIFTAPTSHGKTTLLLNLTLKIASNYPQKEMYLFSYEEDRDSILMKALNTYQGRDISLNNRKSIETYFTNTGKASTEFIKTEEREPFIKAKDRFFNELIETRRVNIHYSNYNSDTLIEAIRYLHKHANPGAILIDYIQLLNLPQGKYKTYSRQEEVKEVCIALKDLAVETGLPIILGAQFNREVTNQLRLHPTKIGEAGDIERIANLIVGLWNNNFEAVGTDGELKEIAERGYNLKDTIYAKVLKNRDGRVGLDEIFTYNGNAGVIDNATRGSRSSFK